MATVGVCVRVYVCVHACACRFEPRSEGPGKPNVRIMGLSHQEQWKVLERGSGSETRDGGGERLEKAGSRRLCAGIRVTKVT